MSRKRYLKKNFEMEVKPHPYDGMESHREKILCPKCNGENDAEVIHTFPFYSYVHTCEYCGYVIMESEWQEAVQANNK